MNRCRFAVLALVLALAAALPAAAQSALAARNTDPDLVEVRTYPLSMDKVERLAAAIDALNQLEAADPALKSKMDAEPADDPTIDEKVRSLDTRFPEAANVVHQNGLSSHDYIVVSLAFLNDVAFVAMKRQGAFPSYPPGSITPANAAFVEANYSMLQQLSQRISGGTD
jgi:hypothetical protein